MSREDSLVTTEYAEQNLSAPGLVIVEVDEDTTAYDTGHIPGAVKINWRTELQDPVRRDFVDRAGFEKLLSSKGISNDNTVILYLTPGYCSPKVAGGRRRLTAAAQAQFEQHRGHVVNQTRTHTPTAGLDVRAATISSRSPLGGR